jgi:ubiquinone/menaquinone biosynthesis C-methylase UbiE
MAVYGGERVAMSILKKFYQNTRRPEGLGGRVMLSMMNFGHNANALWGLSHIEIAPAARILDIGCGGGKNIGNLLGRAPQGRVWGVDYAQESVEKSERTNKRAVLQGRAKVVQASVSSLPFEDGEFDVATAFETIYFWPELLHDFVEVRRVLKAGGVFLICNEAARPEGWEKCTEMLDLSVYTKENLSRILLEAGFCSVSCDEHTNGKWLCVTAQKPGGP